MYLEEFKISPNNQSFVTVFWYWNYPYHVHIYSWITFS